MLLVWKNIHFIAWKIKQLKQSEMIAAANTKSISRETAMNMHLFGGFK